jgi:hypothetical protein
MREALKRTTQPVIPAEGPEPMAASHTAPGVRPQASTGACSWFTSGCVRMWAGDRRGFSGVSEACEVLQDRQADLAGRSVAVLGHDDLGDALLPALRVVPVVPRR